MLNRVIRTCIMAAFAVGLAFAASVAIDDTVEGQRREANGRRECKRSVVVAGRGWLCLEWGRVISPRETRCRRLGGRWDINLGRCHFNTDVTQDNNRGSCTRRIGTGVDPCAAGRGRPSPGSSGFMPLFSDGGPSFWEWLLWQEGESQ